MQKRFTAMVPQRVLTKLGWTNPATWAEVFDFLSEKGMLVSISRSYDEETLRIGEVGYASSWERASEDAVMKCLEVLS